MVEASKSIDPVEALILSPLGVALNVPPVVPVTVGDGSLSVALYVAQPLEIAGLSVCSTVIVSVAATVPQPPVNGTL